MRLFKNKIAQSTAEYAIVIGLVIAAAVAMQIYVRRGLQGGVKFVTDNLKSSPTGTRQYEPYYLMSEAETTRKNVYSSEEIKSAGQISRVTGKDGLAEETTRASKQVMRGLSDKD